MAHIASQLAMFQKVEKAAEQGDPQVLHVLLLGRLSLEIVLWKMVGVVLITF